MARRILRELKIDKISAVDRPCQQGAEAVLIKRAPAADHNGDTNAEASLDRLAKARATSDGISYAEAYTQVLGSPEGMSLYKSYADERAAPDFIEKASAAGAIDRFKTLIARLEAEGMSHQGAITAAARRDPTGFDAWEAAGHPGMLGSEMSKREMVTSMIFRIAKAEKRDGETNEQAFARIISEQPEWYETYRTATATAEAD